MKYYNSNFTTECVHLSRCPLNAKETHNKLVCLCELDKWFNPQKDNFILPRLSKRRERLVNMFWAFTHAEQNKGAATI